MKLLLMTQQGVVLRRDAIAEMVRRARDHGTDISPEQEAAMRAGLEELENEMLAYADSLGPEHQVDTTSASA